MKRASFAILLGLCAATVGRAEADTPLLQEPTLSKTHIAFAYAGDLWTVGRDGGEAPPHQRRRPGNRPRLLARRQPDRLHRRIRRQPRRLRHPGRRRVPHASRITPASTWPSAGRLTARACCSVRPDQLFRFNKLFTVPVDGGRRGRLPLPMGEEGPSRPTGAPGLRAVLEPPGRSRYIAWKRYRGGASPIWIAALADSHVEKVPRTDSNDFNPLWFANGSTFSPTATAPSPCSPTIRKPEKSSRSSPTADRTSSRRRRPTMSNT